MLNLDTHVLLFALSGRLRSQESRILRNAQWSISAIVLWEIAKLVQLGRIDLDIHSPDFSRALAGVHIWPLDLAVCRNLDELDFRSDPADEIIAATSITHQVALVIRDRRIRKSKVVPMAKMR